MGSNPQLYYNSFGHQQGHYVTYGYPTAMSSYSSYSAFPGYSAYPAYPAYPVHMAKREAEAEPQMFLTSYGSQGLFNTAFNSYPTVYSGYPRSFYQPSYNNFRTSYGKREAEAKPEAEAEAEPKPEAKAEAEPQMFPTSYGSQGLFNTAFNTNRYPTVYSGYPRSFYQPSNNNFGYRNFYGKREADSEPEAEAEADAALVYGRQGLYQTAFNTAYPTGFGTVYSGYRN